MPKAPRHTERAFTEPDLRDFFDDLGDRLSQWRIAQSAARRKTAASFSVFDFISPSESVLSNVLRFFLDPSGSHGQEELFLVAFLKRVFGWTEIQVGRVDVTREAPTYLIKSKLRRIDVLITGKAFVLGIENKKFAQESANQVQHYCDHLERFAGNAPWCLVFLTPSGAGAASICSKRSWARQQKRQLCTWSWERDIPAWLRDCRDRCEAEKLRHFIDDFIGYIRDYLSTNPPELDEEALD